MKPANRSSPTNPISLFSRQFFHSPMTKPILPAWHFLLACLAGWMHREQQQRLEFVQTELAVAREMLGKKRPRFNDDQRRRLAAKGKEVGRKGLLEIASLVTPDTLLRWHRELIAQKWTFERKSPGRPPVSQEVMDLTVKLAKENPGAGFDRIQGMLANLGHEISDTTVKNILKQNGIEPAPVRTKRTTWAEFLRSHTETLAACDFFTTEVWTLNGLVTFYVLFVMEIATRRVHIAGITTSPNAAWMKQVARNLTDCQDGFLKGKLHLIMDRDGCFTEEFREILKTAGVKPVRLPPQSPNLNAFAERWVRSIKEECLDRMIFFGEKMFRHAVCELIRHYHAKRNHQGLENKIIEPEDSVGKATGEIVCRERLGGLLKYYHRCAA
jgi:putative transposase